MNELLKRWRFLYSPDQDGGSGGSGDEDEEGDSAAGTSAFQRALEGRNNDGVALSRELWDDNYKLRRKNARLSNQVKDLSQPTRSDGSRIISKDEAAEWEAYKALNLKPDAIKTTIEERDSLKSQAATFAREKMLRDIAEAAKFDLDVFTERDAYESKVGGKTLTYEVREVESNGEKVKVAYVKDGTTEKPLAEYAQENWAKHLPSLVLQESQSTGSGSGTPFPSQYQGTGGSRPTTVKQQTDATLKNAYASPEATKQ